MELGLKLGENMGHVQNRWDGNSWFALCGVVMLNIMDVLLIMFGSLRYWDTLNIPISVKFENLTLNLEIQIYSPHVFLNVLSLITL